MIKVGNTVIRNDGALADGSVPLSALAVGSATAGQVPAVNGGGTAFAAATPSSGVSLATTGTPEALGSASRGSGTTAARSDHVHPPTGLVQTTGAQTIAGAKTFQNTPVFQDGINMYSTPIVNLGVPSGDNDAIRKVDAVRMVEDQTGIAGNKSWTGRQTYGAALAPYTRTVAQLAGIVPSPVAGDIVYVSDGRKPGEGSSAGTGVLARFNGTTWRSLLEDAEVAA